MHLTAEVAGAVVKLCGSGYRKKVRRRTKVISRKVINRPWADPLLASTLMLVQERLTVS